MSKWLKRNMEGYLFILPWLIGVLLLALGPMAASLGLSLTKYEILTPPRYIGMANYQRIWNDELFWVSLWNTVYYVVVGVPLRLLLALFLAMLLNQQLKGMRFFRTIFYLPSVTAGVAVSLLWSWIFEPEFGVLNALLATIGINGPSWLGSTTWAMPALIIMSVWNVGRPMLIFLAGLQSVPSYLYEVVELDGGGAWTKFRTVTVPMMTPIIFFNLIMTLIQSFQVFTNAYIMTGGGPANATLVYILYLYNNAFQWLHMGYASALAWVLFAIVFILTLAQVKFSDRWVYYEGVRR
ncbi:MAG: sugar ABC transporter permease [Firmicutes bacterium]|jgi:multiple sugar transport system permease protein|nr:sugar ABC transporter permease [Bacillota bacterium]